MTFNVIPAYGLQIHAPAVSTYLRKSPCIFYQAVNILFLKTNGKYIFNFTKVFLFGNELKNYK